MPAYYDYLLGGIPTAFIGGTGLALIAGGPLEVGMGVGGALAITLIVHGMFVRAPTTTRKTIETIPKNEQPNRISPQSPKTTDGTQQSTSQSLSAPVES